jgi:hypothetical protein
MKNENKILNLNLKNKYTVSTEKKYQRCCNISLGFATTASRNGFYGPECYLMHLTDRCRLFCKDVGGGGGENKRCGGLGGWGVGGGE